MTPSPFRMTKIEAGYNTISFTPCCIFMPKWNLSLLLCAQVQIQLARWLKPAVCIAVNLLQCSRLFSYLLSSRSTITAMGRHQFSAEELIALSQANGYKMGSPKEEYEVRDVRKHAERMKDYEVALICYVLQVNTPQPLEMWTMRSVPIQRSW
jgi:hypothetical protein